MLEKWMSRATETFDGAEAAQRFGLFLQVVLSKRQLRRFSNRALTRRPNVADDNDATRGRPQERGISAPANKG
jgi:hypothetical protein